MIVKKPSIFIYTNHPDQRLLGEVCAGIEEEGVFFEVFPKEKTWSFMKCPMRRSAVKLVQTAPEQSKRCHLNHKYQKG